MPTDRTEHDRQHTDLEGNLADFLPGEAVAADESVDGHARDEGGLVDPRDVTGNDGEPLPLPDEPATDSPVESNTDETVSDVQPTNAGLVDPRHRGGQVDPGPTGIGPPTPRAKKLPD